jgi:hypothetical protein
MIIDEKLFSMMLKGYTSWAKGPEQLLGFVTLIANLSAAKAVQSGGKPLDTDAFKRELAGILIREIEVDIRPYNDYNEILSRCLLTVNSLRKLDIMIGNMKQDIAINNLVEDTGVLPSEETLRRTIAHDLFNLTVIERIRPYVTFV